MVLGLLRSPAGASSLATGFSIRRKKGEWHILLWRESLLPLGCAADPKKAGTYFFIPTLRRISAVIV